jgi:CRP/FNR family transcriptional regulator, dissimilatory nitrate respiration regulator
MNPVQPIANPSNLVQTSVLDSTTLQSILQNSTLLSTIPWNDLAHYINTKAFNLLTYEKNRILHFDGDPCHFLEIILTGNIIVERIDEPGNLMTISVFFPDDMLGGNLIFSKNPAYPMTVRALTEVTLLQINQSLLFDLCSTNTHFLRLFLQTVSDHALLLGDKIKHTLNRTIRESITAYLKQEYHLQHTLTIQLNTTKKALADRIGVQRTSLSRELQKMKQEGLILVDTLSITILDHRILK